MIDLYFAATPNAWKVTIMLEETGLPYNLIPVSLGKGEQYTETFRAIAPNGRIPAIVDHDAAGEPLAVFESGAILIYLAEKTGRFLPADVHGRSRTIQWVMWQMAGLGPMAGQNGHFLLYAPEKLPYAIARYGNEVRRLYGVLDHQLGLTDDCVTGQYSIADMACFPWIMTHKKQGLTLDDFGNVKRWFATLRERPALQRGLAVGRSLSSSVEALGKEAHARLYGYEIERKA
ncbi:glutathione S-transferase N-terminal domain-containing protein [Bradyrhizobium sp. AUGA SZCCT0042]|uniref:glutathione S-transferase N-terminal domain-containing protein n=1 Tax=Bradyrhizobium sp. AUGA SZCCT0042 TaxID=2807651 RepID=UPI001BA4F7DA|nr:glutathione S-transferase N-terminal domain-containing protein [Bradyrhizobium sp. AUGA SZCCT0042]MBR1297396.1 glutathione S-transferase N-terminal domain-containing protein [Bradyrhizobium sp. AUGA SZCCT0042]